jgi:hypothetical protein
MRERKVVVEFTRSRPDHSDDNAHVEQKTRTWALGRAGEGGADQRALSRGLGIAVEFLLAVSETGAEVAGRQPLAQAL